MSSVASTLSRHSGFDEVRAALALVPSPLTVVTTISNGRPHATTVGSFCPVLAQPPGVVIVLNTGSELLTRIRASGRFAVNLLGAHSIELAVACSRKGPDKLKDIPWRLEDALPVLQEAAAWLVCEVIDTHRSGDHVLLYGAVSGCGANVALSAGQLESEARVGGGDD